MATRLQRHVSAPARPAPSKRMPGGASANAEAEHILLETGEAEFEGKNAHRVLQRFALENRVQGLTTELALFEGGWLGVLERRNGEPGQELIVNLRSLDPKPALTRYFAMATLRIGFYLMGSAALLGWIVYRLAPSSVAAPATSAVMMVAAIVAVRFAVRRTREQVTFRTKYAQTMLFVLTANFGSFRACRALVPKLVRAINSARKDSPPDKSRQLRDEMREHYRLRDVGFLTDDACAAAAQRILAQFD